MPHSGLMRGSVSGSRGEPLEEVNIVIVDGPTHIDLAAVTRADGAFEFGSLQSGSYVIKAYAADAESPLVPVRVVPDKVAYVEIRLGANRVDENVIDET